MNSEQEKERRQFVRARGRMRFIMEPLETPEDEERAMTDLLGDTSGAELERIQTDGDPAQAHILETMSHLVDMVEEMRRKLDALIARQQGENVAIPKTIQKPILTLSGGGFSFLTDTPPEEGRRFRIVIELSRIPLVNARCVAEVKWVRPVDDAERDEEETPLKGSHEVGMEIVRIREADRERIIHAVFRLQREDLRSRRNGEDEAPDPS